jgi:LacI family transcriptional regulator
MAIGAIRRLQDIGCRIPKDISITGFDDIRLAGYITPTLTTVRINIKDVGFRSFMCLKDLLERRNVSTCIIESPRLMVRQSTAPPAKAG